MHRPALPLLVFLFLLTPRLPAAELEPKPADPFFRRFNPVRAPRPEGLQLRKGDRLAICGDSITEQKMYSRIIETYLAVCVPELEVTVRQFGWSGERAPGFLARMTNDVLRFKPTVATTCYGMNDHEYRVYQPRIGDTYRSNSLAIVRAFRDHRVRVIQGSPGCIGIKPPWSPDAAATPEDLNTALCELRNIGVEIATAEKVGFADVFWPMLTAGGEARKRFGPAYAIAGKDGVHPGWAGSAVMAYAFLKSFGLDGDLGTFTVDLASGRARASEGHTVLSFDNEHLRLRSRRYPFCATGELSNDNSVASGLALVPFHEELNRFRLVVRSASAKSYRITWGGQSRTYSADALLRGVNLAADFPVNPFSEAFNRVDAAVAAKQAYETRQIKDLFHGLEGRTDMKATANLTERVRRPLADAIQAAFVPVEHTLQITAE